MTRSPHTSRTWWMPPGQVSGSGQRRSPTRAVSEATGESAWKAGRTRTPRIHQSRRPSHHTPTPARINPPRKYSVLWPPGRTAKSRPIRSRKFATTTPIPTDTATMPTGRCHSGRDFPGDAPDVVTWREDACEPPFRLGFLFNLDIRHIVVFENPPDNAQALAATAA